MKARTLIKTIAAIVAVALTACSPSHQDKTHMSITGLVSPDGKTSGGAGSAPCAWASGQWQLTVPVGSIGKQFEFKRTQNNELTFTASFDRAIIVNGKVQDARAGEPIKVTAICTETDTVKMDVIYGNGNSDKMDFQVGSDQASATLIISAKRGTESIDGTQNFQRILSAPIQAKAH